MPIAVRQELVAQLYGSARLILNSVGAAAALFIFLLGRVPLAQDCLWISAILAGVGVRLIVWRAFRRRKPTGAAVIAWGDLFLWLIMGQALLVGSSALFMAELPDPLGQVVIVVFITCLASGIGALYAPDPRVVSGYICGSFAPAIMVSLALGDMFHLILAPILLLVGGNLIIIAHSVHASHIRSLMLGHEREVLLSALAEAAHKTELASQAKSDFLATMSHELRTPLNAIIGFSELMTTEMFGPIGVPRYAEYCADIHGSAQHLLSLINDILDSARVEAGKYELNVSELDLDEIARSAARLVNERARQKAVDLTLSLGEVPKILADERAIRQILLNLLSNAVKFTSAGGFVELATALTVAGEVVITVRDSGIGIPAEDIKGVLDDFGRGRNAHLSGEAGTGLGLSIVRNLVALHGGRFDLSSRLGEGTAATVFLPPARVLSAG
jgi:two-component system cell cycle sensor histidine kinase PleC